jgi:hypothetical protein
VGSVAAGSSRVGGKPGAGRVDAKVMLAQLGELEGGKGVHAITSLGRSNRSVGDRVGAIYRHGAGGCWVVRMSCSEKSMSS